MRASRRRQSPLLPTTAAWIVLALSASPVAATRSWSGAETLPAAAQATAQHEEAQAAEHDAEEAHAGGESLLVTLARLANFLILFGGLGYLLKQPLANYLHGRGTYIRRELVEAEEMRGRARQQIEEVDAKLRALPAELEALKSRGAEEVAAEEARIRQAADIERERLREHTRREIEQQLRIARQALRREAAGLAVDAATARIRRSLTPDGHLRLVDRYAEQVRDTPTGDGPGEGTAR